jgi:hypothetical protein
MHWMAARYGERIVGVAPLAEIGAIVARRFARIERAA